MQKFTEKNESKQVGEEIQYEAPAIIYEGLITTRAGTGIQGPKTEEDSAAGVDLFGD